jgi:RND family efflux transporter MFP subunit
MAEDKARLLQSLRIERPAEEPAPRRRWPVIAAAAVVVLAASGLAAYFGLSDRFSADRHVAETAPQRPAPAAPARIATAEPQRSRGLVASGYVVARRKATVAAEVTGKVVEVLIEEGMVVNEGDVVARLDSVLAERDLALAQSRAEAAEAAVAAIAADLKDAERIYSRYDILIQRKAISEADLTKAEARAAVLRAQLKQAQAQLATARLDANRNADVLEKHRIRAPFTGVVVDRSAQPGEMISPLSVGGFTRTGICTLVDMDSIEIEVDVNEAFIGRVQSGMPVEAVLDAYPDWTIPAAVIAIVPTANREKATVKVRIGLKQKDPRILPDMAVKVTFAEGAASAAVEKSATPN